jgi:hypothetical protein
MERAFIFLKIISRSSEYGDVCRTETGVNTNWLPAFPGLDWEYMKLMKAQAFKLEPRDHGLFELIIIVSTPIHTL